MRKLFGISAIAFLTCLFAVAPVKAATIDSFKSDIHVEKNGQLDVKETITIDFGSAQKHGVFRFIPTRYNRSIGVYNTPLQLVAVTDDRGRALKHTQWQQDINYEIKIGDPNITVSGVKVYVIEYTVKRAVNYFPEDNVAEQATIDDKQKEATPEVYFNVTGNEWPFPIKSALARVFPPEGVNTSTVRAISFVGARGSKQSAQIKVLPNQIDIYAKNLNPDEGLTIAVRLPAKSISLPTKLDEVKGFVLDWYSAFLLPLATLSGLYFYWLHFGKDPDSDKPISVEWQPPKELTPAEVGTLIDERVDLPDITSTLIDLAARGYLKITQVPYNGIMIMSDKDYVFDKLTPPADAPPLKPFETLFLGAMFGYGLNQTTLSSMRGKFYPYIEDIRAALYDSLVAKRYFQHDPNIDRSTFVTFGAAIMMSGVACVLLLSNGERASAVGLFLSGLAIAFSANAMPVKTKLGAQMLRQCLAFKRFVKAAEKERIKVLAKDDPTIFGRLLPYAMVMGCADQWAHAFKDLLQEPPDWYQPYDNNSSWSTIYFYDSLFRGMYCISGALNTPPPPPSSNTWGGGSYPGGGAGGGFSGFGGGGFSGGGFGGGGGGSW